MIDNHALYSLVGRSAWTERTLRKILQAARYRYSVLITGDAGTGKRTIARAIHAHSGRVDRHFIPFHCGRLPARLAAQQLFGHARGESRLARGAALGAIGAAEGGTLYLNEIADLDLELQHRLAQELKSRKAARDVRLIASSSRDLKQLARQGQFRFDLLYLINAIRVDTLPLRKRVDDIVALARHLIARITLEHGLVDRPLTASAAALLQTYQWPGNVRELSARLERAIVNSPGSSDLDLFDFPELIDAIAQEVIADEPSDTAAEPVNGLESITEMPEVDMPWPSIAEIEARHIERTLRQAGYQLAIAARLLGIEVGQLQEKIRRYQLPRFAWGHLQWSSDAARD